MVKGIYNKVEFKITRMIEAGEVEPDGRLPSERALAGLFKVSRNTVREAIRALVEKGILSCRRGAGSFVTPDAGDRIAALLKKELGKKQLRLTEIFEVRKILEPGIAARAARTIDSKGLDELDRLLGQQKDALETGGDPAEFDRRFHETLVRFTGNSVLASLFRTLDMILEESRAVQTPERAGHSIKFHTRILDALRQGDPKAASLAMAEHMDGIEKLINQTIKE